MSSTATSPTVYLQTTLARVVQQYTSRNPTSEKLYLESENFMPGGNTRTILHISPFPLTFASGAKASLTSVDDDTYIDFLGEYSAGLFGHSNEKIAQAVKDALAKGWNYGGPNTYEKQFAKKVVERFGKSGIEKVRFTNSGTEANMMAIAGAIAFTRRNRILVFSGAYHGGTLNFPMEYMRNSHLSNVNLPHNFVFAPFNNVAETKVIIDNLPSGNLAAILVEPVQGAGGCRPATTDFLNFLRSTATEKGALFIVDEVMASRLGPHGYCATLNIKPDLITLGKYVGGGMTFGAFGGRSDIMDLFNPAKPNSLHHAGTYNNNLITMAAGVAALDIYSSSEVERLNRLGEHFKIKLQDILAANGFAQPHIMMDIDSFHGSKRLESEKELPMLCVSGMGSMVNVRFSGENAKQWQMLYYHHMLKYGIYVAPRGTTALHLELTKEHIDVYIKAFEAFMEKYGKTIEQYSRKCS